MTVLDSGAGGDAADSSNGGEGTAGTGGEPLPGGLPPDDPNGESATPEEIAAALKGSGMNLPVEPKAKAKAAASDDEEGDDPDKPKLDDEETDEQREAREADEAAAAEVKEKEEQDAAALEQKRKDDAAAAATNTDSDDKYSFEVEDLNGVTFKITADTKMEDVLAEFEPKNNGQILDILEKLREVKEQQKADLADQKEQTQADERAALASEIRKGWDSEVTDLTAQKRIPEGKDGEARVSEVYKFMADENAIRMKADRPTLNSFEDALDKLENKEAREKAVADAKAEKEDARKKGGLVGGSSAAASSAPPVYKAGSARNANQAIRSMGLLN